MFIDVLARQWFMYDWIKSWRGTEDGHLVISTAYRIHFCTGELQAITIFKIPVDGCHDNRVISQSTISVEMWALKLDIFLLIFSWVMSSVHWILKLINYAQLQSIYMRTNHLKCLGNLPSTQWLRLQCLYDLKIFGFD